MYVCLNPLEHISLLQVVFASVLHGYIVDAFYCSVNGLQDLILLWSLERERETDRSRRRREEEEGEYDEGRLEFTYKCNTIWDTNN